MLTWNIRYYLLLKLQLQMQACVHALEEARGKKKPIPCVQIMETKDRRRAREKCCEC